MLDNYWTNYKRRSEGEAVSSLWALLVVVAGIGIYALVFINYVTLPNALMIADEAENPGRFISERAFAHAEKLAEIGPRVGGSDAVEKDTIAFLLSATNAIKDGKSVHRTVEIDHQIVNGGFYTERLAAVYQGMQNIVVRVSAANRFPTHSILMNAHMDSVPTSPGAGDDGSMTVVLLEILRVMANSDHDMEHGVIFLFNGCEENALAGAHAFIAHHQWADTVRVFINMDAAGIGGKEIMFQASSNHTFLMKYYQQSAHHPLATAMAEEMFQQNLIPSDTDYRIFRDFGKIPGMDFAYSTNGYVYHTQYDGIDRLNHGSLQHAGNNILALAEALANADEVADIEGHADGQVVFFDFMGAFLVMYSESTAIAINYIVSVAAILLLAFNLYLIKCNTIDLNGPQLIMQFGLSLIVHVVCVVVGAGLSLAVAYFMDAVGKSMGWFSQPWLIYGLYFSTFYFGLLIGESILITTRKSTKISLVDKIQMILGSHSLLLAVLLITLTAMEIRTAYLIMISLFFYCCSTLIFVVWWFAFPDMVYNRKKCIWLTLLLVGQVMPLLYYCSLAQTGFATFIPLAGRNGVSGNQDVIISILAVAFAMLMGGFIIPILNLCRHRIWVSCSFLAVTLIAIIITVTPVGFPFVPLYAPQRFDTYHLKTIHHPYQGSAVNGKLLYIVEAMDPFGFDTISEHVTDMSQSLRVDDVCEHDFPCELALRSSRYFGISSDSHYLEVTEEPILQPATTMTLLGQESGGSPNVTKYSFEIFGPSYLLIFISPLPDVELRSWTMMDHVPTPRILRGRKVYVVNFTTGLDKSPFQFDFEIETPEGFTGQKVDVAVGGRYLSAEHQHTEKFQEWTKSFPDWCHVAPALGYFESWQY